MRVPKTRATKRIDDIYHVALSALDLDRLDSDQHSILLGVAAMLHYVVPEPKPKRERNPESGRDFENGRWYYNYLRSKAPHAIAYEPASPGTFTQFGKALRLAQVTQEHLDALIWWLNEGGLDWMQSKPAWGEFVRKCVDWMAKAVRAKELPGSRESVLSKLREERDL